MNAPDRWVDGIARGLIRCAARRAPLALSDRLSEEWLADLAARGGSLPRLRLALGCCWATAVIAREVGAPLRAAASAAGDKTTVVYAAPGRPFLSQRTVVSLLIISLHGLVIYGLATGMTRTVLQALPGRIDVVFLPKPAPPIQPPPRLDPTLAQFRAEISPPPVRIIEEPPVATRDPVGLPTSLEPSAALSKPVSRVVGGPGAGFPDADDFYPAMARSLGEKGVATVGVCVDGMGRLTGSPTIEQSSGSTRLDEGAVRLARAGSGHYRPTTEDGNPVSACYAFRVRFKLRD